jgi:hypothetical protein
LTRDILYFIFKCSIFQTFLTILYKMNKMNNKIINNKKNILFIKINIIINYLVVCLATKNTKMQILNKFSNLSINNKYNMIV